MKLFSIYSEVFMTFHSCIRKGERSGDSQYIRSLLYLHRINCGESLFRFYGRNAKLFPYINEQ